MKHLRTVAILLLGLFLVSPSSMIVHALYTVNLPSNTIFADDLENYGTTNCTASTSTVEDTDNGVLTSCLGGWAYLDNNCGGTGARALNNTYSFSPSHSLSLQMNQALAKCDVDRRGAWTNTTSIIQLSVWFQFTNNIFSTNNLAGTGDDFHIALEFWDTTTHWEAVTFFKAKSTGAQPDLVTDGSPGVTTGTDHLVAPILKPFDLPSDNRLGYWHHEIVSVNVLTHKWAGAEIDGWSYNYLVAGTNMRSIADSGWTQIYTPHNYRIEFSVEGNTAFTASTDRFFVFFDNIQLTDISSGGGNGPNVQFSLFNAALMLALFLPAALIGLSLKLFKIGPKESAIGGTETPKSYLQKSVILITIVAILVLMALLLR